MRPLPRPQPLDNRGDVLGAEDEVRQHDVLVRGVGTAVRWPMPAEAIGTPSSVIIGWSGWVPAMFG